MADNPYDVVVAGMPPDGATNPYERIVIDMGVARGQQVKANILAAKDANPDTTARALAVSKRLGVPVDVAERNLADFEAIDNSNKYDELLRNSPTLKSWMAEPVNARLGTLDIPKLAGIEAAWQGITDYARAAPGGALTGLGMGLEGVGQAYRAVGELGVSALGLPKTFDVPWYLSPSEILERPGTTIKEAGKAVDVPQERQTFGTQVVSGVGQIGAQIAATIATGGGPAFALMFGQGVSQMAEDVKKAGRGGTVEGNLAMLSGGAITGLLEKTGIDLILNRVPPAIKSKILSGIADLAIAGGIEAAQETVEKIAQNALANYYLDSKKDLTEGVVEEASVASVSAALVRAMLRVGRKGRPDTAQPDADATALDKMLAQVNGVDLKGRSPEKMAEFLGGLPGGDRNVYVPAEAVRAYFQNVEPEEAAKLTAALGITGQLEEALATGGDVVIPLNQYLAHAPDDMAKGWRDEIRLRASGMSAREAKEYADGDGERAKELGETISKRAEEATRHNRARDEVVATVERQLQLAGESPEAARQIATLYGERYATRAARSGIAGDDAVKAYGRSGVEVRSDLPEAIKHAPADDLELLIRALKNPRKDKSEVSRKGPTILQYIAGAGGIVDDGGELKARDLDKWHVGKPFQRRVVRDAPVSPGSALPGLAWTGGGEISRYGADAWTHRLWEAGYFRGFSERPEIDDLYRLIDLELRGKPTYSEQTENMRDWRDDFETALQEVDELLNRAGVDARTASVEEIRAALRPETEGRGYEQSSTPVAVVRGDELAPMDADIKTLREAARAEWDGKIMRSSVVHPDLGRIEFSGSGRGKFFSASANPDKLRLVPVLREIVQGATLIGKEDLTGRRVDDENIVAIYRLEAPVSVDNRLFSVRVIVFEDKNGNKFYNLATPDNTKGVSRSAGKGGANTPSGDGTKGPTYKQNVGVETDGVNMHIQAPDGGAARGNIVFSQTAAGETRSLITLFKDRNLSTVLHETGHLWLEELHADAGLPSAPEQLKADLRTARDYLGAKGDDPLTVEQHETWARTVEAYLMEGKSPSVAMSPVLARFKAWLVSIYKTIAGLRVEISDEVRGVMDRLIATDEAIEEARTEVGARQLFASADQAGMTEAEFNAYTNSVTRSRDRAEQAVLDKLMDEVRARRTAEWKAESAAIRNEVRGMVDSQPDIVALRYLSKGELPESLAHLRGMPRLKLSRSELIDEYGNPEIVNALPRSVPPLVSDKGGVRPGDIAEMLGFSDGRAMIDALTALAKEQAALKAADGKSVRATRIDAEVDRIMKERHGDMLSDGSIEAEALSALHNEARSDVLAAELRAVARQAGKPATPYQVVREWAKRAIAEKPVGEVSDLSQYTRAEAKAARLAEQALAKGDADEALRRKQEQMISHALWIEAKAAKAEIETGRKAMDRYAGARTIKSMDQDYLEKIHDLLERFDLKPRSMRAVERSESLREWADAQASAGVDVAVPQKLLDEAYRTSYRRMTVEEFRGLSDSVKQLAHLGRLKQELIDGNKKREHEAVVEEAVKTAGATPQRGVSQDDTGLTPLQKKLGGLLSGLKGIDASLLKMETLFEWLDGDKAGTGVFTRMAFRPLAEAQGRERDRLRDLTEKLRAIYAKVPQSQRDRWLDIHDLPGLAKPTGSSKWNKTEVIAMALNIGNESNLQKLLGGYEWDEQVLRNHLNERLTKEEWQFVQDVWDLIETQWPDLAAVHRRVNGVEPPKIERMPVPTPYGVLPGGYYKVGYDPNLSIAAQKIGDRQDLAATVGQIFPSGMTRPSTRAGATHERTGFEAPIRLSLDLIPQQIIDAAHDIEFREAVLNAHKFLNDNRVKQAIQEAVGPEYERQIAPWLQNIAHEWQIDRQGLSVIERFASVARTNVTIVGLGLRISTMLAQTAGFANSVQRLGVADMGKGIKAFALSPVEQTEWVWKKSAEMRNRANDLERDMRAAQLKLQGKTGALNDVRRLAFQGIAFMDAGVSIPTWLGAYQQGLAKGMDDRDAVYYADKMVRDTQGAGAAKDMAAIQRGGPILKLFTMFYSYFNVLYNRQRGIVRDAREGQWGSAINQTFFLMAVSPLLGQFLTGQGPEDDESFAQWAARNVVFGLFAGLPWARDVANAASNKIAGKNFGGARLSPVEGFADNVIRLGADAVRLASGEDASESAIKNTFNVAGVLTALPLGQVGQTSQFVWDAMVAGSQHPEHLGDWLKGLAFGPEKKK